MKRRGGYTLIELLTVIFLIVILIGMLYPALKYLAHSSRQATTKQMLETAQLLQEDFEQARNPGRDPADFPYWNTTQTLAAGTGTIYASSIGLENPTNRSAVVNVALYQTLLTQLYAVPNNAKVLQGIPSNQIMSTGATNNVPVLLDGWGNPIIFVPAGGLTGVTVAAATNAGGTEAGTGQIVTIQSTGIVLTGTTPSLMGQRPFWASAGPDELFSQGDDNFYSFEN